MVTKFLIPIDGSRHATAAVAHLVKLKLAGLPVQAVLVNVQEPATLVETLRLHDADALQRMRTDAGAELLAPAEAMLNGAGIEWESEVAGGQPANLLVELLENYRCDGVIVGARGVADHDASGIGPVVSAVLAHSPVPVTVVRAAEPEA